MLFSATTRLSGTVRKAGIGDVVSLDGLYGSFLAYAATLGDATLTGGIASEAVLFRGDDGAARLSGITKFALGAGNDLVDLTAGAVGGAAYALSVTVDGGTGNDVVWSGSGNDLLDGGYGDDRLEGGSGNDSLYGRLGNDTLRGEDGRDFLDGGEGDDILDGGAGDDRMSGGLGNDTVIAGTGNDFVAGQAGDDVLDGGAGDDTYTFDRGWGRDTVLDAAGSDTLRFGAGIVATDLAFAADGADLVITTAAGDSLRLVGQLGADTAARIERMTFTDGTTALLGRVVAGTSGDDRLEGSAANDTLFGGEGDDILVGRAGNDDLQGGVGNDTADYADAGGAVQVTLTTRTATGGAGTDTLTGIENLVGSAFGDKLFADNAANVIDGGAGDDNVVGLGGDDLIQGGAGNDTLSGNDGADTILGGNGDDFITGLSGNDTIYTGPGNNFADAGDGNDFLNMCFVDTCGSVSALAVGDDVLLGGPGDDYVLGWDGNDVVDGGPGNDYLEGVNGDDSMTGGSGADAFVMNPWSSARSPRGYDVVTLNDYNAAEGDSFYVAPLVARSPGLRFIETPVCR